MPREYPPCVRPGCENRIHDIRNRFCSAKCAAWERRKPRKPCEICGEPVRESHRGDACSKSCAAVLRVQRHRDMATRVLQQMHDAKRRSYFQRVVKELQGLVPRQETFTRDEVLKLLVANRKRWIQHGHKTAYTKYGQRPGMGRGLEAWRQPDAR